MKLKNLFTTTLLSIVCATAVAQTDEQLFTSNTYGTQPYRIPAIVQTGNNDILVFADKRYSGGDVGQLGSNKSHIDLVYRRWNGTEWGDEITIADGNTSFGYGDAAVVADREDPNNILLMCAAGNVFFTKSFNDDPLQICRFRSTDGGKNWNTTIDNVTEKIYSLISTYNDGVFFSSGRICQSSRIKVGTHYRLYAALVVTNNTSYYVTVKNDIETVVVYSDDFGESWNVLGGQGTLAIKGGNEAKCEELPNGSVLVSSRNGDGRYYRIYNYSDNSTYAAGSWEENTHTVLSGKDSKATNGEVLIVPAIDSDGNACNILLQSLPAEADRNKVTIFWQELSSDNITSASSFTGEWGSYPISSTTSAYSSMIWQADGNIGFVWEDTYMSYEKGVYNIEYKNLSLSTITGGAYTNVMGKAMSQLSCTNASCANASYSTLYLPYGVELPEGVTAYTGTIDGNTLVLSAIAGGVVPERTAAILVDAQRRASIDLTMVNTSVRVTDNALEGTLTAISGIDKSDYYVLGHGTNHIGFYHPSSTTLKANAAYIPASAVDGANALQIRFAGEDETTGIDNSEFTIQNSDLIYDLMGRRVNEMQPGRIYIVNGKKVMND